MRAVIEASAWPSHLAMTAIGTPRRCSAVPHEWRASCRRIGRTLAAVVKRCHMFVNAPGVYGSPAAFVHGFMPALWVAAGFSALGVVPALLTAGRSRMAFEPVLATA